MKLNHISNALQASVKRCPILNYYIFLGDWLTIKSRSDIMAPKVIDITGPISGDTNIAAVILGALFSTKPSAARELYIHGPKEQKNHQT